MRVIRQCTKLHELPVFESETDIPDGLSGKQCSDSGIEVDGLKSPNLGSSRGMGISLPASLE